jgi:hypothetical protein
MCCPATAAQAAHPHPPLPLAPCRYSILILTVEIMGITAVLPYALLQVDSTRPAGSGGLPPDDGISCGEKVFCVNVLVPCYKESMQVGAGACARPAHQAPGCAHVSFALLPAA